MKRVLTVNRFTKWSFQIPKKKVTEETNETEAPTANKHPACIPYISELSDQLQRVFRSHGIPSYHKHFNTLRFLLVNPKDKSRKENSMGWYIVLSVVSVTKRQPGCWAPGSENTHIENTPTQPSRNTPLPPVIATYWMTLRSW